jgi:benzoate-CoA ligase
MGHVAPGSPPSVSIPRDYNAAVDLLDRHVLEGRGDRLAIVDDRGRYTYRQVFERAGRAAAAFAALGVEMEERVLLCLHDTADFHAAFLGAMKIGAVPVPVNTLLTPDDYTFLLQDSRARVLVVSDALHAKLAPAAAASPFLRTTVVASSPLAGAGEATGARRFDDLLAAAEPHVAAPRTTRDDVAFWLYSSGSTGRPKAAMHVHSSLVHSAVLYAQGVLGLGAEDVVFSAAKLFFAYGLGNALTFPFSVGGAAVLLAERPTPAAVMRTLRAHAPTVFCGVPTLFAAILADEGNHEGSPALRVSTSAGEALPAHVGLTWRRRFGTDILDGIGSTEMLHIFVSNRPGDIRYGTTGKPVPGYQTKLVDESGEPVADGEEGALWVRGPTACTGYWNDRERTLATFHGAWTRTGDVYVRDAEGYYTYSGRSDDMLKVGGIWVSPFEIESALAAHERVLEAAVVGKRDDEGLVKPHAFVVLKGGAPGDPDLASELVAFVKQRLAPYKYPRWIDFVPELPKTATGKIQRFRLR